MGRPMAGHLLAAGHPLVVHTRSKSKADELLSRGATWADSPGAAAKAADIVFICVTDTPDVEAVVLGDKGIASAARPGLIVVDHSTISPSATRRMAEALAAHGAHLLDAPVSGGDVGAKNATLSIMVGGDEAAYQGVLPFLQHMGKTFTYCGASGNGQLTKLVNQILVSVTNLATCEGPDFRRQERAGPEQDASRGCRRGGGVLATQQPGAQDDRRRFPARLHGRSPAEGPAPGYADGAGIQSHASGRQPRAPAFHRRPGRQPRQGGDAGAVYGDPRSLADWARSSGWDVPPASRSGMLLRGIQAT